jgi:murein DD-endopeptidase MepM/ murein hydrolase activator NlpD
MTQQFNRDCNPFNALKPYMLLKQGCGVLGAIGLLSSGLAVAQTAGETNSVVDQLTAPEPVSPPKANNPPPVIRQSSPKVAPKASSVAIPPVVTKAKPKPAPAATNWVSPPKPTAITPKISRKKVQLSAPKVSVSTPPAAPKKASIDDRLLAGSKPKTTQTTATNKRETLTGKNNYIDSTNYSIGSTGEHNKPPTVVVQTRSNSCSTSGTCTATAKKQPSVAKRPTPKSNSIARTQPRTYGNSSVNIVASTRPKPASNLTVVPLPQRISSKKIVLTGVQLTRLASPVSKSSYYQSQASGNNEGANPEQALEPEYNRATRIQQYYQTGNTALLFPLSIPASISSVFGWRVHPISGQTRMHRGTDLAAPMGTPVLAAYPGSVETADYVGGYGLTVILRHLDNTQESRYAHLSEIFVQPGEWVEQGRVIGLVGSTGNSTGPHLHFEWRHLTNDGWVAVDSGLHLQYAMENLIQAMKTAQANPDPQS